MSGVCELTGVGYRDAGVSVFDFVGVLRLNNLLTVFRHTYIHILRIYLHTYMPTYLHTYIPTCLHAYMPHISTYIDISTHYRTASTLLHYVQHGY